MSRYLLILALSISWQAGAETQMVKNLKDAPGYLCTGHPNHDKCVDVAKKMIAAVGSVSTAGTLCKINQSALDAPHRQQCSEFIEVIDYIDSLKN
ncbi:hypothetical protein [Lonsdalea quercina]|uniref:hypothetical protein n=1 Tax=Lonsdalea quercina TaxID=71657 RepID=UPI0039749049